MSWAERTRQGLESWFTATPPGAALSWSARILGWCAGWVSKGIIRFIEEIEPEGLDFVEDSLKAIADNPLVPENIRAMINRIRAGGQPIPLLLAIPLAILMILPVVSALAEPMARVITYGSERVFKSGRLDPGSAVRGYFRGIIPEARLRDTLRDQGLDDTDIEAFIEVSKFYPNPADLVRWQAREVFEPDMISKYGLDDELGGIQREPFYKAGMTDEQIVNYWRAHWEHASWQQVVEMLHRGLITEPDVYEWFRLVEVTPYWRDKLIATAWAVPTRVDVRRFWDMRTIDDARLRQIYQAQGYHGKDLDDYVLWTKVYVDFPTLLARWKNGWITLDEVRARLVSLGMPADRVDELIQEKIEAEGATRTAVDRDLTLTDIYKGVKNGRITRDEAVSLIQDLGYDEYEARFKLDVNIPIDSTDDAAAERQLAKSDIFKAYQAGVITREGARSLLAELRYSAANIELLLKIFDVQIKPPDELKLKEAGKADVVLGVKKGIITPEEGLGMLLDIGYTPDAAGFILLVRAEESPFSPVTFDEFKDRTQSWRRAAGLGGKPMFEEIKRLGTELVKASADVEALRHEVEVEEARLTDEEIRPAAAEERLRELRAALYKAVAEERRIQTDYNAKVAEWRQSSR